MQVRRWGNMQLLMWMGGFVLSLGLDTLGNIVAEGMQRRYGLPLLLVVVAEVADLLCFYPFLGLLSIRAIPGDVPLVLSIKEAVLPLLPLVLVSILVPTLAISLAFGLSQGCVVFAYIRWLLPLLVASLLFYIENLLLLCLLCLRLSWFLLLF